MRIRPIQTGDKGTVKEGNLNYLGIIEGVSRVERYGAGRQTGDGLLGTDPGSMLLLPDSGKALASNQWKKVAVVVDATTITLYQDGEQIATTENTGATPLSDILGENSVFWIGKANWGEGEFYNGYIDNFQVYDGALTAEQVAGTADVSEIPLLADFDFESMEGDSFSGGAAKASVTGDSDGIMQIRETDGKALDLRGKEQTLYVTKADGTPVLHGLTTATIVFDSYFEGNSYTNDWPFYAAKDIDAQDWRNPNYIAVDENSGSTDVIRQADQNSGKADLDVRTNQAPVMGEWKNVAVVHDADRTSLYIDGELVKASEAVENAATLADILGESGGIFQIGRANWGDGEFYNGMLDNFRIYGGALTADEVSEVYGNKDASTTAEKIADFTFDNEETGFAGAGAVARPFLVYDTDGDGSTELFLAEKNRTYLNLLQNAVSPLKGQEEITISYDSKPYVDNSTGKWPFYAAENTDAQTYQKEKYIGIQEAGRHMYVHYWDNAASGFRLPSIDVDTAGLASSWRHIDLVISSEKTTLYVNGEKKDEIRSYYPLQDIIGENGGIAQIGKANWGHPGGIYEYYGGYIDNFQIYDKAIHPEVNALTVSPKEGAEVDSDGRIKVLAGHLQEYLDVKVTLANGSSVTLAPDEYEVTGYKSELGNRTVTITYGGKSQNVDISVYNVVESTQSEVLDENGKQMFTVKSTWYDYLSDPEREGKGNYNSNSYVMKRNEAGKIVSSESEFVQFNKAVDKYWREKLTLTGDLKSYNFHPIYWGDFYSLDEAYRDYDEDPNNNSNLTEYQYEPGEGVSFKEYGENFYGSIWGYNAHQYTQLAAQGSMDPDLGENDTLTMNDALTPYFNDVSDALAADEQGSVYMNIYENVLMPFKTVTDEATGIDYYEFQSGDAGKETIHISEDPNNTVTWVPDNRCYDARNGYVGHDGISFLPFNQNGDDKDVANCGFAAKMAFNFRSTYDGKLSSKNGSGERVPIRFEFNGDDDFFLYIDGKLALDIGGSHGECEGVVDFAEQTVTTYARTIETYDEAVTRRNDAAGPAGSTVTKTFEELGLDFSDPSVEHKAVIYYTERGKLEGNLKIRFNFPQENTIAITNTVNTDGVNDALKDRMAEIIKQESFGLDVSSDYKESGKGLQPVDGEEVAYNDGTRYSTDTLKEGHITVKGEDSILLVQRVATEDNPTGFLDEAGTLFAVSQTADSEKYATSWNLYDSHKNVLGSSEGYVIDDEKSTYDGNTEGQFALYDKDGSVSLSENGVEIVNLTAAYVNTVKTNAVTIKKEMYGDEQSEDTFKFQLTLSNLFGSGSEAFVYVGDYTVYEGDDTTAGVDSLYVPGRSCGGNL